jgi:hypothetical protein
MPLLIDTQILGKHQSAHHQRDEQKIEENPAFSRTIRAKS